MSPPICFVLCLARSHLKRPCRCRTSIFVTVRILDVENLAAGEQMAHAFLLSTILGAVCGVFGDGATNFKSVPRTARLTDLTQNGRITQTRSACGRTQRALHRRGVSVKF